MPAGHTILLVEDHAQTRQTLAALFDFDGFNVVTANDGGDALDRLREGLDHASSCSTS